MTKKSRFGDFMPAPAPERQEDAAPVETAAPAEVLAPTISPPTAPEREERRPFSTRLKPSLKRALDGYVMELKLAGWPVSQEILLEEIIRVIMEDKNLRDAIKHKITQSRRT